MADIDLGRVFEALNGKLDMPTGVSQSNIDYVVESQLPTASNNYTWYRKYKSGWVEQGGFINVTSGRTTVSLLVEMLDTNYNIQLLPKTGDSTIMRELCSTPYDLTITSFMSLNSSIRNEGSDYTQSAWEGFYWEVKGMGANE